MERPFAYYNEIDPFNAEWMRELMKDGLITDGEVDERDIRDVLPADLMGFRRCHFFAGIAVWDYALTRAGWRNDGRTVWTGSCPCQPFSVAGTGKGHADERHLWPTFFSLIEAIKPDIIFGEQVASGDVLGSQLEADFAVAVRERQFARANKLAKRLVGTKGFHYYPKWLDAVCNDLEGVGYAVRSEDAPSAGFGSPHIRQRLYFAAERLGQDALSVGRRGRGDGDSPGDNGQIQTSGLCDAGRLEHSELRRSKQRDTQEWDVQEFDTRCDGVSSPGTPECTVQRDTPTPGPVNGFWERADWVYCRDGKWRPFEPSAFPLVNGSTNRVGILRGAGNAINAEQATEFIKTIMGLRK